MARPTKLEEDRKVKFGISLDRDLFDRMVKEKVKKLSLDEDNNTSTIETKSTYGVKEDQYISIYYNKTYICKYMTI